MKTATAHLTFNAPNRRELIRIAEEVQACVDEPGLHEDVMEWLDKVAPPSWMPEANEVAEEPNGRLDLGPWQQVFYCELDGGWPKRVVIKAMRE